jgi:hypothetical protein
MRKFQLNNLTLAMAAVGMLSMGAAQAATNTLNGGVVRPSSNEKVFMGNIGSTMRVQFTVGGANMTGAGTLHITYYNGATALNTKTVAVPQTNAAAAFTVDVSAASAAQAGGAYDSVKLVLESNAGDDWDGADKFLAVMLNANGSLVVDPNEAVDAVATLALANAAASAIPVNASYDGIKITAVQADDLATPTKLFVTLNSDPFDMSGGANTVGVAPADGSDALKLMDVKSGATVVAQAQVDVNAVLPKNVLEVRQTQGATNAFNPAKVDGLVTPTTNAVKNLGDGSGNVVLSSTIAPSLLAAPAYSATGKISNATAALGAPDANGNIASGNPTIYVRMDSPIADGTANDADVEVKADTDTFTTVNSAMAVNGVANTADGQATLYSVTLAKLAADANGAFRFDATGKLQYTKNSLINPPVWKDVTIAVKQDAGATPITHLYDNAKKVSGALSAQNVYLASVPALSASKTHGDGKGKLDGAIIDFNVPVSLAGDGGFTLCVVGGADCADANKGKIAVKAAAIDAKDKTLVNVTFDTAAKYDWNKDSVLDAKDDIEFATFTTATTGKYSAELTAKNSKVTYNNVYNKDTGTNATASFASAAVAADGAAPVVLSAFFDDVQGTTPAIGNLRIVGSEALNAVLGNLSNNNQAAITFGGSPLSLMNLNDGVANAPAFTLLSKTTIANDTVTISNVSKAGLNTKLGLSESSASGMTGAADGVWLDTEEPASVNVAAGQTVYNGPKIVQSVGFRSAGAVGGNIDSVLVKFDKGVKLATAAAIQGNGTDGVALASPLATASVLKDGMFKLRARVNGVNYDIPIPADKVDLTSAASGYVTLTVPTPGIVGTLTDLTVEYDNVAGNYLVSTDAVQTTIADESIGFDADDADSREAGGHQNSTTLYTQEIQGLLTTDGAAAVAKGTIIRADLVTFEEAMTGTSGNITVPCTCASGKSTVAIDNPAALDAALKAATAAGAKSLRIYVRVTANSNSTDGSLGDGAGGVLVELFAGNPGVGESDEKVIEASIEVASGKISGPDVSGTLGLLKKITPMVVDTAWQVTNDGKFRFNVGSDKNFTHPAFVLVSLKQPDDKDFRLVTSPVPSFANHLPFLASVNGAAGISQLGTVNLSKFVVVDVETLSTNANKQGAANDVWQILDTMGEIAKTADKTRSGVKLTMADLMLTIDKHGDVISLWRNEGAGSDTAFVLEANKAATAFEVNTVPSTSIDSLGAALMGGNAIAFLDDNFGGAVTGACLGGSGVYAGGLPETCGAPAAISGSVAAKLFVPVTSTTTASRTIKAGWALLTMNTAKADLSTLTNVTAVIEMGSGKEVKSWFKGASANSLSTLNAGKAYLMYFEKDTTGFAF